MNPDLSKKDKSQIGIQILAYLNEHPEAQDTLEGIVEWWLLERQTKFQKARVKEALNDLVALGMILEIVGLDSQIHYRVNSSKYDEIRDFVRKTGQKAI